LLALVRLGSLLRRSALAESGSCVTTRLERATTIKDWS
jgi:hypothetical protein